MHIKAISVSACSCLALYSFTSWPHHLRIQCKSSTWPMCKSVEHSKEGSVTETSYFFCFFFRWPILNANLHIGIKKKYYIYFLVHVKSKLKSSKSPPIEPPLSHRKHCSRNASSVAPPLIPWLCDITLHPCQSFAQFDSSLSHKN